jgi:hypothetical protein
VATVTDWFISSDNVVYVEGLQLDGEATYENDATVTAAMSETDTGTAVDGATSVDLDYVTGSDGEYRGTVPDSVTLVKGRSYTLTITATAASGEVLTIRLVGKAKYHDGDE